MEDPEGKEVSQCYSVKQESEHQVRIYLAGKVSKNCWRPSIAKGVNALSNAFGDTCPSAHGDEGVERIARKLSFPVMEKAIFGKHAYVGPYFVSCDHGCWHGDNTHGLRDITRETVFGLCLAAVMRADLVFAWIDSQDCFGTIAELGFAKGHGKQIIIAGPEKYEDMWFVYLLADRFIEAKNAIEGLHAALGE
jgi:hypothetical protein